MTEQEILAEILQRLRDLTDDDSQPLSVASQPDMQVRVVNSPVTGDPHLWVKEPRGDSYIERILPMVSMMKGQ